MKRILTAGLAVGLLPALTLLASGPATADDSVQGAAPPAYTTVSTGKDIDGNGKADVVQLRKSNARTCTVRVRSDRGVVATHSLYDAYGNPCQWHGAAALDTRAGAELSILTRMGAHTYWHSILTWRNGDLAVQKNPGASSRWPVDGSYSAVSGVQRMKNSSGQLRLVQRALFRVGGSSRWEGERTVLAYSRSRDAWIRTEHSRDYTLTTRQANDVAGWLVPGLPRWAD